jgi:hypothetical protein
MADIMLRPDLKTAGGEVNDVVMNGRYAGTLTLVYREGDRISGSIQLERDSLSVADKEKVIEFAQNYIQAMMQMDDVTEVFYELVIVGESRNRVEYHIYDQDQDLVAESLMTIYGNDVVGKVHWMHQPEEDEIEAVSDLIVSDFDENEVDTFVIDMEFDNEIIETIELTHEDLLDYQDTLGDLAQTGYEDEAGDIYGDYSVILVRDDGDTLTYEIYQQTGGDLPIGTATIDITSKQITGFIDFREPGDDDDREIIATLLMRELDKEKEYDSVNLTMLHNNQPIDELMFEVELVH